MPAGGSILDHLRRSFAEHASRVAVESWPDGPSLTYAELEIASAALAGELRRRGVMPGSMVPIIMPRCAEYLVAVVAILRCGAAYAPIDPTAPRREAMLEPLGAPVVVGREPGMLDPGKCPANAENSAFEDCPAAPHAPAYVMYTSGTTGMPKGVVVPHRAVVRLVIDTEYARFGPEQRWGVMSAVAFDASTLEIWGALLHGGCCVVQTNPLPGLDDLAEYFTSASIGATWLTASLFNALVDEHPMSMAAMQQLLTGGERESMPHIRRFKTRCPDVTLIHGYGPTENTTFSLCHTISDEDAAGDRIPIGIPISGSTMRVVAPGAPPDAPEHGLEEGELLVGGLGLALGYLNDAEKTTEKFVFDGAGERWYRTGDLVHFREDGTAVFIGRVDRQVKIRGHRVEPDGVETELARCAGVEQAAVVVAGDTAESRRMIAFFVPAGSATTTDARARLAERLPPTQMPEQFVAVALMPIGPTGKVDRSALLEQLDAGLDATGRPSNEIESALQELFHHRLGQRIGRHDRFQDVGGHSLLAMRLSADARRELGVALPAAEILRRQTIASIGQYLQAQPRARQARPVTPTREVGDIRRRTSLEHARDDTAQAMLVHLAWHVTPAIPIDRLRGAWQTLLERHDALRTEVRFSDDGPRLIEHHPRTADVFHAEHDRLVAPDGGDALVSFAAYRSFDPGHPPARMHVWEVEGGSQLVLMVFHHASIDEWSLEIISCELDALLSDSPLAEPEPYSAFVAAEHEMLDPALAAELAERISQGLDNDATLPPAGPQAGVNVCLDQASLTTEALLARSSQLGVAPAALAAAAFTTVLQERFGPAGRWLMTPFARRGSEALQRVVGCCLDMRVLEARGDSFESIAAELHEQFLAAQDDRVLPLEALLERVRKTAPARADDAIRFGLTYRHMNDGPRRLGASKATPTDIEQPAARFALCLHVERRSRGLRIWLEASRNWFTHEDLRRLGERVADLIHGRSHQPRDVSTTTPLVVDGSGASLSTQERHELSTIWYELLGADPSPDADFFLQGGTSLLAMRMSSAIHKRLGRRILLNQFLRRPTFVGLMQSIRDDYEQPYAEFARGKAKEVEASWCLAVPGSAGRPVDYHSLWSCLGGHGPDMLAFDVSTIATGEATTFAPDRFYARFTALAHAHAMMHDRRGPMIIMGYSLGGLVALDMAARLTELGHDVRRVVLLDAYAPAYLSRTPAWYAGKLNARIRNPGMRADATPVRIEHNSGDAHAAEASRLRWRSIHALLSARPPRRTSAPVTLVRSDLAWKHIRPMRHAHTNGLAPLLAGDVDVRVVDIEHLAMLTTGAATIANTIRDLLTD